MKLRTNVEILASAGCFASLEAALSAGADSVYFGLAQLNMRARSRRSFQLEDLGEIMRCCRAADARGYLTLNTLLYDHDIRLCHKLLEEAAKQGVDAVIAADMACVLKALELGLEVHLSTQLSVSNYESFRFYSQYCDRIVLARELNLSMIRKIHQQIIDDDLRGPSGRLVEIEAFAHGALCIAVSGRCGMSLFTDNASANRGACIQNCRREYEVTDKETGKKLVLDNHFIMSPNDISTLEFLDQVLESGVHTLKLEGRTRSPEYVKTVTSAYRQAIDAIHAGTYNQDFVSSLSPELEKVYNRGLSSGYYLGREQGWSGAYGSKATRQKILSGKVVHHYANIGVATIETTRPIAVGEEFAIIGPNTGVVSGIFREIRLDDGTIVERAPARTIVSIKVEQRVRVNDQVYTMAPVPGSTPESRAGNANDPA